MVCTEKISQVLTKYNERLDKLFAYVRKSKVGRDI